MTDGNPWGEIIEWPAKERKRKPPPAPPDPLRPAQRLLRAWWAWERWCRVSQQPDPETGRRPYHGAAAGERQTVELAEALTLFAAWAGVGTNELLDRMMSSRRVALKGREPGRVQDADPDEMRYALAAAVGHS